MSGVDLAGPFDVSRVDCNLSEDDKSLQKRLLLELFKMMVPCLPLLPYSTGRNFTGTSSKSLALAFSI
jgi:hypothetical protein